MRAKHNKNKSRLIWYPMLIFGKSSVWSTALAESYEYMLKNNILKIAFGRSWEKTNKIETLANKMIKVTVLRYKKDGTPYTKNMVLEPFTSPQ